MSKLYGLLFAEWLCFLLLFLLQDIKQNLAWSLPIYSISFVFYVLIIFVLHRMSTAEVEKIDITSVICVVFSMALLLLLLKTNLSTDIYRYVWDGGLLVNHINPYTIIPTDAFPRIFNDQFLFSHMSWKNEYTVYPPLAQIIFAGAYSVYQIVGIIGAKLVFSLPLVLLFTFFYKKVSRKYFLFLILNPFVLFESFNGGHIDFWMILFFICAIYFFEMGHIKKSAFFLALSILTKLYPLIFLPYIAFALYKKDVRQALVYVFITLATVGLFYLPLLPNLSFLLARYVSWASHMEFNSSFYTFFGSFNTIALPIAILFLTVNLFVNKCTVNTLLLATVIFFSFASVVHPWYVSMIFFIIVFSSIKHDDAFTLFNFVAVTLFQFFLLLTYISESTIIPWVGITEIMNHIKLVEYTSVYLLLGYILYINVRFNRLGSPKATVEIQKPINILAIFPIFNEESTVLDVVATLRKAGIENILVGVDCKSTDRSLTILQENKIPYIISAQTGFDQTLNQSVSFAMRHNKTISHIMFLDAGNKYSAETFKRIIDSVQDNDLVLGSRTNGKDAMYWHQKLGTLVVLLPIWILFFRKISDISPLRIIRLDVLLSLEMKPREYRYTTEMLVKCLAIHARIREVPVILQKRVGQSKISSNYKNSLRAGRDMLSALRFSFFRKSL